MPHALTVSVFRRNPDDTVPRSGSRAFEVSGLSQSPTSPSEPLEQDRDPLRECCQSPLRIIDVMAAGFRKLLGGFAKVTSRAVPHPRVLRLMIR
jgi:hypothetical protein